MAGMTATPNKATLTHEHFCLPRPEATEPRIEGFISYSDDASGRSVPTSQVTRCQECGAATYQPYTTTLREIR